MGMQGMGLRIHSVLDTLGRSQLGSMLGFQMGGLRNLYDVFGWKRNLRFIDYYRKYRRHPIARRVVNSYPNALWADPPILAGDPTFTKAWQGILMDIPIFATIQKLDKLCRIGRYAILVVGLDDGGRMDTDARGAKAKKIIFLQPYSEQSVHIKSYVTNTNDPRYGQPLLYTVYPGEFEALSDVGQRTVSMSLKSFDVHFSRVLHIAEGALESPIFGGSCLEPIYNDLDDLEKVSGGSAEVFWLNSNRGLHVDVDKEMELKGDDADALEEEIDEYSNNLRRVIRTRGVKISNLGTDFLDPTGPFNVPLTNVCTATGIPKSVLTGQESGQLASQQNRASWSDRCDERVAEYANPTVLIPLLRLFIDVGVLPMPKQLAIQWPDQFKMNPLERAQTSAQMARSAANLAKMMFTIQQVNHANAEDARPQPTVILEQPEIAGLQTQQLSLFASTDPTKSSKGTKPTPSGAPPDATGNEDPAPAPKMTMMEPLLPDAPKNIVLLSEEECRSIIGFGKHMPVFDSAQVDSVIIGTDTSQSSATDAE